MTPTDVRLLQETHASYAATVRQLASEMNRLEQKVSDLVDEAYGLTAEEIVHPGCLFLRQCFLTPNEGSNMKDAIYIRHNFSPDEILEDLWRKSLIAVRYDNLPSTDPEDYTEAAGKHALHRLHRYRKEGVMVGAVYRAIRPSEILIGEIEPGTPIEIKNYDGQYHKTLQLINTRVISYLNYPVLAAIQPRQGTVTGWPSAKRQLAHILDHERLMPTVQSLAPSQLEVLCQEYLRSTGNLSALVLPIGRSLIDVDIVGVNEDGKQVVAQVTHSRNCKLVAEKLKSLQAWNTPHRYFFGPKSCFRQGTNVEYVAIEEVFTKMKDTHFLKQMLGQEFDFTSA